MSIFGSREDDPLLQDDPLAPSDHESSASSARASEQSPSGGEEATQASSSSPGAEPTASQSDASSDPVSDPRSSFEGKRARRAIVRGLDTVETGALSALNTAFDQGWRLDKIVYREETADLLFLLRQQEASAGQGGLIV